MTATPSVRRGRNQRRDSERQGRRAESLACLWLIAKGWRIIGRRRRLAMIEVDIIARRGDTLAIVEVKYRQTIDAAIKALDAGAARRLARAARQLAAEQRAPSARVDLIALAPRSWPRHLVNVVRAD